jgi:hypothetical protein
MYRSKALPGSIGAIPGPTAPDVLFRVARTAPVGSTHAVCELTGATVCGIKAEALEVLNKGSEAACFVAKCAGCFAAVLARGRASPQELPPAGRSPMSGSHGRWAADLRL